MYVLLTFAQTLPVSLAPRALLAPDGVDPLLNSWILWWNAQAVPLSTAWWNGLMFFPQAGSLALSETLLGLAPLTTPIVWMSGSPILAYNIAFLLSFPLSALSAHLLVHRLTGRHAPGLVAGLMFGFHPYRASQLSHLQVLSAYGMPVALYALHRYLPGRERRWLALFASSWLFQSLVNGYFLFYFSVLVALWLVWWARRWRDLLAIATAWIVGALPLVPLLLGYVAIHERLGLERARYEIEFFSADILAPLSASSLLEMTKLPPLVDRAEGQLFPGLIAILILLAAWKRAPRPVSDGGRFWPRVSRLCFALSVLLGIAAWTAAAWGPWSVRILAVPIEVSDVRKPLSEAVLFLLLALATTRRSVAAVRAQSTLGFYLMAVVLLWLFTLGPTPKFFNEPALYVGPYRWLMAIPGFDSLRVPPRFALPMFLCLAVAAGLALEALLREKSRAAQILWTCGIAFGVVLEGWIGALPVVGPPAALQLPETLSPVDAILELPLGAKEADVAALYRSTVHRMPVVNGLSGYEPPHYGVLRPALGDPDESVWEELRRRGTLLVVADGAVRDSLSELPGATRLGRDGEKTYYYLPLQKREGGHRKVPGRILSVSAAYENGAAIDVDPLRDRDRSTRWRSERPQRGGEELVLDLHGEHRPTTLIMALGLYPGDYPRYLIVEAWNGEGRWDEVWRGPVAGLALEAAIDDPREVAVRVPLKPVSTRYVRLRQTGVGGPFHWSIAEIALAED